MINKEIWLENLKSVLIGDIISKGIPFLEINRPYSSLYSSISGEELENLQKFHIEENFLNLENNLIKIYENIDDELDEVLINEDGIEAEILEVKEKDLTDEVIEELYKHWKNFENQVRPKNNLEEYNKLRSTEKKKRMKSSEIVDLKYQENNMSRTKSHYAFSNYAFKKDIMMDEVEVMIMAVLSSFNDTGEFRTRPINIHMIFSTIMNWGVSTNNSRSFKMIEQSLDSLFLKGLIDFEYYVFVGDKNGKGNKKENLFVVSQKCLPTREYTFLDSQMFYKIFDHQGFIEKAKRMAVYVSVSYRCYYVSQLDNKDILKSALMSVCFEKLEGIGKRIGIERQAVSRVIQSLENEKILAYYEVVLNSSINGESKYYISKYEDLEYMKVAVKKQLERGEIIKVLTGNKEKVATSTQNE
ncbi:hypothetical protein [Vagococcus sp.]|uniref:hypothetical protein n=1 Tax=Vagococcus sp. TaxID=1933889 RepID=UPI003F94D4D2